MACCYVNCFEKFVIFMKWININMSKTKIYTQIISMNISIKKLNPSFFDIIGINWFEAKITMWIQNNNASYYKLNKKIASYLISSTNKQK